MKKIFTIIGVIVVVIIALVVGIFFFVSATSEKLVCKSSEGDITIMYNDKTITGYVAKGVSFDMDGQKKYAEQVGIENYIEEFKQWFASNTTGKCE